MKAKRFVFGLILTSFHELIYVRETSQSSLFGKFPFSESLSKKYKLWIRTVDFGLTQLSVYTDRKKEAYLACKIRSNRPNRLTRVVSNSNALGIKLFDSGISISFKYKFHIIMLIQCKKNLNAVRHELNTTLSKLNRSIFQSITLVQERNFEDNKKKSSICRQVTSPTKLQNRSFQVVN